jgi:hypothetical protein
MKVTVSHLLYLLRNDVEKARVGYRHAMRTDPTAAEWRRHVAVLRELSHALAPVDDALATNIGNVADDIDRDQFI